MGSFWDPLDGSFGGPIWGSLFGILWCDPLVSPLYGTVACCLSFVVGLLADLDYLGAERVSLLFGGNKLQSVSDFAHHYYAGLDNHGADLSWSSTSLISVLV